LVWHGTSWIPTVAKAKLYKSEAWLRREYIAKRKSVDAIAKEQKVTVMTIYRQLKEFGLMK
jgi:hypothetical protein